MTTEITYHPDCFIRVKILNLSTKKLKYFVTIFYKIYQMFHEFVNTIIVSMASSEFGETSVENMFWPSIVSK